MHTQYPKETRMERQYTVALQDGRVLPAPDRIAAEIRFVSALERALGEPQVVAETLHAWQVASESQADQIDQPTAERAVRWPAAYEAAVRAGLAGLHGLDEAGFDVKLVRRP
jgi:hypothetical protein